MSPVSMASTAFMTDLRRPLARRAQIESTDSLSSLPASILSNSMRGSCMFHRLLAGGIHGTAL